MQERQIQARFCLSRRNRSIAQARHSWRIEKQPSMRLERQRLRGIDDDFGRAVFVGDVYRSRAVLVVQPRIGADQLPALLVFVPPLLPPPPAASAPRMMDKASESVARVRVVRDVDRSLLPKMPVHFSRNAASASSAAVLRIFDCAAMFCAQSISVSVFGAAAGRAARTLEASQIRV